LALSFQPNSFSMRLLQHHATVSDGIVLNTSDLFLL
jgi:hypothetical protein